MNLFVLKTITILEKGNHDWGNEWECLEGVSDKDYIYYAEDNCYFLSLEEAKEMVYQSLIGRDDSTNYITIVEMSFNKHYAFSCVENMYLFKYDCQLKNFQEIPLSKDEVTKLIAMRHYCSHLIK